MVCVRVTFHEKNGNHENGENDEDSSDDYKQGVECWIRGRHGNHENDENTGIQGANHGFQRSREKDRSENEGTERKIESFRLIPAR